MNRSHGRPNVVFAASAYTLLQIADDVLECRGRELSVHCILACEQGTFMLPAIHTRPWIGGGEKQWHQQDPREWVA